MKREPLDHTGVLNLAAKYLSRRHDAAVGDYAEPWRFPIIDSDRAGETAQNRVTFLWRAADQNDGRAVSVVGTFDNLWDATPCEPVQFDGAPTLYHAATVLVPKGQVHYYKFVADGQPVLDAVNPQRVVLDNGIEWSRFFTEQCAIPVSFERRELTILARLTNEILPFTSDDAQKFMDLYYFTADKQARETALHQAFRLEQPVGAVNYIDKLLAREERHRLVDYKICLKLIDNVLRSRFPGLAAADISKDGYQNSVQPDGGRSCRWLGHVAVRQPELLPPDSASPHLHRRVLASEIRRQCRCRGLGLARTSLPWPEGRELLQLGACDRTAVRRQRRLCRLKLSETHHAERIRPGDHRQRRRRRADRARTRAQGQERADAGKGPAAGAAIPGTERHQRLPAR